jgi:hypothetical protein
MSELVVPKRKVGVELRLRSGDALEGHVYAATMTSRGLPEQVVDRLNDPFEEFLPFATGQRHILLRKTNIVTVDVKGAAAREEKPYSAGLKSFDVEIWLRDGTRSTGRTYALVEPAHARALDVMNRIPTRFVSLVESDKVVIVNFEYVVAVLESAGMTGGAA